MAVKIKTYRVTRTGKRGNHLPLPKVWLDDLALNGGDRLDIYRDEDNRLIICPPGVTPSANLDRSAGQARELRQAMEAKA
jgi:bifunctional DNA-binding transcriptional regulator/antitoxin component of YhaV-PrlF toxin-antitoxin module